MIYLGYDYINKYQLVISYLIQNAIETGYAVPHIEKEIAYSQVITEFEKSDVTLIAFSSCEKTYSSIFENNAFKKVDEFGLFGWIGYAYIYLFLEKCVTFESLFMIFPIDEMIKKYPVYHEMDIRQLEDDFNYLTRYSLLDAIMKHKGISTTELSNMTGVPFATISSLRFGKRDIDKVEYKTVNKIAKALNIKPDSLTKLELIKN